MKITRSKSGLTYKLTFEFTGIEGLGAGIINVNKAFESFKTPSEAVAFMMKMTGIKQTKRTPMEDLQEAVKQAQQTQYTQYTQYASTFNSQYAQAFGGFNTGNRQRQTYVATEPKWCKVLGLKQTATKDEIKSTYRKLSMEHHPDRGGDAKKFSEISTAYKEAML